MSKSVRIFYIVLVCLWFIGSLSVPILIFKFFYFPDEIISLIKLVCIPYYLFSITIFIKCIFRIFDIS